MLTLGRHMNLFSVNEANTTFNVARVVITRCDGMGRCIGVMSYTAAPIGAPTVEFSDDGVNWDSLQVAPVDPTAAIGITGYRWDAQVFGWKFVRLTVQPPPALNTARGHVMLTATPQA